MKRTTYLLFLMVISLSMAIWNISCIYAEPAGSWEKVLECAPDHPMNIVGFINPSYGITAGHEGEIFFTTDSGKTWPEGKNQTMCRYGLEILNEKVAWSCGNGAQICFTTDGGANWNEAGSFGSFEPYHCRFLSFVNAQTGWIASVTKLGFTADQGKTWADIALPVGVNEIKAISFFSANTGYLLDQSCNLHFTTDGGKTWETKTLGVKSSDYLLIASMSPTATMRFTDKNNGIVIIRQMNPTKEWIAFSTADAGKTWTKQAVPGSLGTVFLSPDAKYFTVLNGVTGTVEVYLRKK